MPKKKFAQRHIYMEQEGLQQWVVGLMRSLLSQDTIVTNDRWGAGCACKHGGYYNCEDKYTPGQLPQHKWEKCTSVDTHSWGYRRNMKMSELMDLPTIIQVSVTDSSRDL